MQRFKFDGGPNGNVWTWTCVNDASGAEVKRSGRSFRTMRECVRDAVKNGYVIPSGPTQGPVGDVKPG